MHPSSLLSYYPTYSILDSVLSCGEYTNINIYVDLKNTFQTLYLQHAIVNIVENSIKSNYVDTSPFTALLSFLSFHKIYSIKKNIEINFFIFFESGVSYYHKNINKKYKISRRIDDLYGLSREKRDLFFEVLQRNFGLIDTAIGKFPNVYVIRLENLEADFIPYYLITRKLVDTSYKTCHLIYSNDHDLYQCLMDNVFIFSKSGKSKKIIRKNEGMKYLLKEDVNFRDEHLPLAMAIIGDPGDDVSGIKGIGPKRLISIFDDVIKMTNGTESLYKNVMNNNDIFDNTCDYEMNKYINLIVQEEKNKKTISNNLKLVSFELLSRYLDNPVKTEILKKKKKIEECIAHKKVIKLSKIKKALEMNRIYVISDEVENMYYGNTSLY